MNDTTPTNPGPPRAWLIAWTLQGVFVLGLEATGLGPGLLRFALLGPLAGLPLLGLYLWLRRGRPPEE
ncbi:MAG: hypothetical protein KDD82_27455 [Planctomycetes bacterium]|nr:hypothetical protein [Planctomycetota bacterium]